MTAPTQFNYGYCDKPNCEYCALVKQANAGAVAPPVAATQADLKAGLDDLENKVQTSALQLEGQRADGDYSLAKTLGARVDAAVSGLVHGVSVDGVAKDKKATDADGAVYIVDPAPTGTFAGHANQIASLQSGTWVFQTPGANETHLNEADNQMYTWNGTLWVKVGTVGNSAKLNDEIHGATDKPVPGDNDEFAIADATETPAYALKKLTWANLKKGIEAWYYATAVNAPMDKNDRVVVTGQVGGINGVFYNTYGEVRDWIFGQATELPDGTPMDADVFPFSDGVTKTPHKVSFLKLRDKVLGALGVQVAAATNCVATDVGDTDIMPLWNAAGTNENKITIGALKTALGSGAKTLWIDDEDVTTTGDEATFTIPAGTNARHLKWEGWAAPQGADKAYPVLVLKQGTTDAATTAIWNTYGLQTLYTGSNPIQQLTHTGSNGVRLCKTDDANCHVKGNNNSYYVVRVYRNNNWVEMVWETTYKSANDTFIRCNGFASGVVGAGEFTSFGIKFLDSSSGNVRPVLADARCEIHH